MAPTLPVLNPTKSLVSIPGSGYDRKSSPICLNLGLHREFMPGGNLESSYVFQTQISVRRTGAVNESRSGQPPGSPLKKRKAESSLESLSKKTAVENDEKDRPSPVQSTTECSKPDTNETEDGAAAEAERFKKLKNLLEQRTMLRRINKELTAKFKEHRDLMKSKTKLDAHLKSLEAKEEKTSAE